LGVDARIGSLEAGKDADIAVFDKFPLEITARAERVYVNGERKL
jgi:imidazolonepropionase-like amidohydrolase